MNGCTPRPPLRGRGASANPTNRFARLETVPDDEQQERIPTVFLQETAQSIVSFNQSPDVEFRATLNPYRGCEHGCTYCYARPTHEYIGFSAGLDFESKIIVKTNAAALLRNTLSAASWKPQTVCLSSATDPYQPVERKLEITRQCLAVLAEFKNPVAIITKNALVTRDRDLLASLAEAGAGKVYISITTLDGALARRMEPRTSRPDLRLDAVRALREAGIPVGVLIGPVIPGLTDHEIPSIVEAAAAAGASFAYYTLLRLPWGVKELFEQWLQQHYPARARKVMHLLAEAREGDLSDAAFGKRMRGKGVYAEHIAQLFHISIKRHGMAHKIGALSTASFRRAEEKQLSLFMG